MPREVLWVRTSAERPDRDWLSIAAESLFSFADESRV
jgi:hypothetical protein